MKRPVLLKETIKEERMEVVSLVERHPKYQIEAQKSKVSKNREEDLAVKQVTHLNPKHLKLCQMETVIAFSWHEQLNNSSTDIDIPGFLLNMITLVDFKD